MSFWFVKIFKNCIPCSIMYVGLSCRNTFSLLVNNYNKFPEFVSTHLKDKFHSRYINLKGSEIIEQIWWQKSDSLRDNLSKNITIPNFVFKVTYKACFTSLEIVVIKLLSTFAILSIEFGTRYLMNSTLTSYKYFIIKYTLHIFITGK